MKPMTIDQIVKIMAHLKAGRGNWESYWQEIADFILPRKNDITTTKSPGQKREVQIYDNTGMVANELLAGALHSMLTNPYSYWFEFTSGDVAIDNDDEVRAWFQDSVRRTHNVINNSNFQTEVHELYLDLPGLGTGAMLIEEDKEMVVRFSTKFIREYLIDENHLGGVDRIYREWKWTADKIAREFGVKNLPLEVAKAFEHNETTQFVCVHAIYPEYLTDPKAQSNKFCSHYFLKELKKDLRVSSFDSFPYVTPRFAKASGELYGRCPGMNALPEVKVLNEMAKTMLIGAQKVIDPPLQLPDDGYILPIITRPGGLNFKRPGAEDIKPVFNDTRIDFGQQAMEERRKRVRDSFYVDQLQLQNGGPQMTATEVMQRTEEKMRLLGPMMGRMQSEFLRPLIDRVFEIMLKRKLYKPIPHILEGKRIDVRYSSFIAKAQRTADGQAIMQTLQACAPFLQLDPNVAMNFDGDKAVRMLATVYGFPQEIIKNFKDVQKARDDKQAALAAQAKQQQQAQQLQQAGELTKTAQDLGALGNEGNTQQ